MLSDCLLKVIVSLAKIIRTNSMKPHDLVATIATEYCAINQPNIPRFYAQLGLKVTEAGG